MLSNIGGCWQNTFPSESDVMDSIKSFCVLKHFRTNFSIQKALSLLQSVPEIGRYISMISKLLPKQDEEKQRLDRSFQEFQAQNITQLCDGLEEVFKQLETISSEVQKTQILVSLNCQFVIFRKQFLFIKDQTDIFDLFLRFSILHLSVQRAIAITIPTEDNKQAYLASNQFYKQKIEQFFQKVIKQRIESISEQKVLTFTLFPYFHPIYFFEDAYNKTKQKKEFYLVCQGYCIRDCEQKWLERRKWYINELVDKLNEKINEEYLKLFQTDFE